MLPRLTIATVLARRSRSSVDHAKMFVDVVHPIITTFREQLNQASLAAYVQRSERTGARACMKAEDGTTCALTSPLDGGLTVLNTSPRILIVDDEPDLCESVELLLREDGCRVSSAENVHHALKLCALIRPEVVVLDALVPHVEDALCFARSVREDALTRDCLLIIYSGCSPLGLNLKPLLRLADQFALKPFIIDRAFISKAIEQHRRYSLSRLDALFGIRVPPAD